MAFKMKTDKNIEDRLKPRPKKTTKVKTKGRFVVAFPTSVATFKRDKDWMSKANPDAREFLDKKEKTLFKHVVNKHEQKQLQQQNLYAKYKIAVKKSPEKYDI